MTTVHVAASEPGAQFLAPHQIVPLLIGATVDEVERELVLQTLARCDGNRTPRLARARPVGAHAAQQDQDLRGVRDRRARLSGLASENAPLNQSAGDDRKRDHRDEGGDHLDGAEEESRHDSP